MDNSENSGPIIMVSSLSFAALSFIVIVIIAIILFRRHKKKKKEEGGGGGDDVVPPSSGGFKECGITFYGQSAHDDNGVGISGVDLFKHKNIRFDGKPVFPGAVFQGDGAEYLYSVLEVYCDAFKKNKTILIHVVDVCGYDAKVCHTNVAKHGNFLVDIHKNGFEYVGNDDGLLKGKFKKIGKIKASDLPKSVWKDQKDYILCSCSGDCKKGNMDWKPVDKCN
jgi:hypothetical protein